MNDEPLQPRETNEIRIKIREFELMPGLDKIDYTYIQVKLPWSFKKWIANFFNQM